MKAGLFYEHGGVEMLQYGEVDTPSIRPDEVLVQVKACSLNHLDVWVRKGIPGLKLPMPHIGGSDIVGVVAQVGERAEGAVKVGERVVVDPGLSCGRCDWCRAGEDSLCDSYGILGEHRWGGFAEYAAVPARNVLSLPAHMPFEQAAAVPLVFLTAWRMVKRAQLRPGETVLVVGAGGGVASAAIQIARLAGARVLATAGDQEKLDKAKALGADEVIDHREPDFSKRAWELTRKRGAEVILDPVGGSDTLPKSLKALAKDGRYVTCGATSGPNAQLSVPVLFWKQARLLGSTMGSRKELQEVLQLVWDGRLKAVVDQVLPLGEIRKAHTLLEARRVFGKLVLLS